MSLSANNPFTQALVVYIGMATFTIGIAFGIMSIVHTRTTPIPYAILLLMFAVILIAGSVFFENRGADQLGSLIGGAIVALLVTFIIGAFFSGIYAVFNGSVNNIGWETFVTGLAISMIASLLIIKMVQYYK